MLGNETMDHTAASGSVIFLENVYKKYGREDPVPALGGVSLKVKAGEFVFVTGRSGSGKTTLIRLLTRELKADQGEVRVLDQDSAREIMALLYKVYREGTTVLVVTHNREIVQRMQKRVITMEGGLVASDQEKAPGRKG